MKHGSEYRQRGVNETRKTFRGNDIQRKKELYFTKEEKKTTNLMGKVIGIIK